jgi:hypothetical protein
VVRRRAAPTSRTEHCPAGDDGERRASMVKHIFVTGGVVSSLGKGLTSAAIG